MVVSTRTSGCIATQQLLFQRRQNPSRHLPRRHTCLLLLLCHRSSRQTTRTTFCVRLLSKSHSCQQYRRRPLLQVVLPSRLLLQTGPCFAKEKRIRRTSLHLKRRPWVSLSLSSRRILVAVAVLDGGTGAGMVVTRTVVMAVACRLAGWVSRQSCRHRHCSRKVFRSDVPEEETTSNSNQNHLSLALFSLLTLPSAAPVQQRPHRHRQQRQQ